MPALDSTQILEKAVKGELSGADFVRANVDRTSGRAVASEGDQLDYKEMLPTNGELAKDVLAFANWHGGLILVGVANDHTIAGHPPIDPSALRSGLAPYCGTRLDLTVDQAKVLVAGQERGIAVVVVGKHQGAYPLTLRRDIEIPGKIRKVRHRRGSLPYRSGDQSLVEPPETAVERAQELGFTNAAPRTSSSFVLLEDVPGYRIYDHINDRFIGRVTLTNELVSSFADPRSRGVSIAGLGGVGKTELAIEVVKRLREQRAFTAFYSASAKTTLLTPAGEVSADPVFADYRSLLRDLAAWLALDIDTVSEAELEARIIDRLKSFRKALLFIDNLETVVDRRVFNFLDSQLLDLRNVYILATARVPKIKNNVRQITLDALDVRDAALLLRHELKAQGLQQYADQDVKELEARAGALFRIPLAIRWYAWALKGDARLWESPPQNLDKSKVQDFCVTYTLSHIAHDEQQVLAAVAIAEAQIPATLDAIHHTAGIYDILRTDECLIELEAAGLVVSALDQSVDEPTYTVFEPALEPIRRLTFELKWESGMVRRLKLFAVTRKSGSDPIVKRLSRINPAEVKRMEDSERSQLRQRIQAVYEKARGTPEEVRLLRLEAECDRHMRNIESAATLYTKAAELVIRKAQRDEEDNRTLLEAATVISSVAIGSERKNRSVRYLEALPDSSSPLRKFGMLAELYVDIESREDYFRASEALKVLLAESSDTPPEKLREAEQALKRAQAAARARGWEGH